MSVEQAEYFLDTYTELQLLHGIEVGETIVLGTGPEKPVLLREELTDAEAAQWDAFKANEDRHTVDEPGFYVVEGEAYLSVLDDIKKKGEPSHIIAKKLLEKRIEWQNNPRFTCNRWERMNAISAGVLLLSGATQKVVFSGGTSNIAIRPDKNGDTTVSQALHDNLKSEGELMRDLMVSMFGHRLFQKDHPVIELKGDYDLVSSLDITISFDEYLEGRYEQYVKTELAEKVRVETHSVNTLQNFSLSFNENPDIEYIGVLCANFQVERAIILAKLFRLPLADDPGFDAEYMLLERAVVRNKRVYAQLMEYMGDPYLNADLMRRLRADDRWIRSHTKPEYAVGYTIGYVFELNDLSRVQLILEDMKHPDWIFYAREVFERAGLNFDTVSQLDLVTLARTNAGKIEEIKTALSAFKKEVSGNDGPREKYVAPVLDALSDERISELLPYARKK